VAAVIAAALEPDLGRRLARYDDAYAARAFGDNMQAWGTSTVLIESGVLAGDPQKQRLRAANVVALVSALHAIATGRADSQATAPYDDLPENHDIDAHLLVTGGHVVLPGAAPIRADLAIRFDDSSARTGPKIAEIGDLADISAVDTVRAEGLFLHVEADDSGAIARGAPACIEARRGPEPGTELVWELGGGGDDP
jgi:hypothetical protein